MKVKMKIKFPSNSFSFFFEHIILPPSFSYYYSPFFQWILSRKIKLDKEQEKKRKMENHLKNGTWCTLEDCLMNILYWIMLLFTYLYLYLHTQFFLFKLTHTHTLNNTNVKWAFIYLFEVFFNVFIFKNKLKNANWDFILKMQTNKFIKWINILLKQVEGSAIGCWPEVTWLQCIMWHHFDTSSITIEMFLLPSIVDVDVDVIPRKQYFY